MKRRPIPLITLLVLACLILMLKLAPSLGEKIFRFSERQEAVSAILGDGSRVHIRIRRIEGSPRDKDYLILRGRLLGAQGKDTKEDLMIYLPSGEGEGLSEGDTVQLSGRIRWPASARNPGQWDAQSYAKAKGTICELRASSMRLLKRHDSWSPAAFFGNVRRFLGSLIDTLFSSSDQAYPYAAIVKAMLLGDQSGLSTEMKSLFSEAGISHMVAISGLHLTILVGSLSRMLIRKVGIRRSFLPVMVLLWSYTYLTGFSMATLRAALMLTYQMAAPLLDREPDEVTSLSLAALIQLLLQPCCILSAGFWLTYSAVLGIRLGRSFALPIRLLPRQLRERIAGGLGVSLVTLPISLVFFHEATIGAFFLNLLVVPVVRWILLLSVGAVFLGAFLPSAGSVLSFAASKLLALILDLSRISVRIPWLSFDGHLSLAALVLLLGILAGYLLFWKKPAHRKGYGALCLLLSLGFVFLPEAKRVTFLDVGQGDCSVIEWQGRVILVDAGPSYESVIEPYLAYRGIDGIDIAILSHPDEDHIAGMLSLAEEGFPIGLLLEAKADSHEIPLRQELERKIREKGGQVLKVSAGDELSLSAPGWLGLSKSKISMQVLSPVWETGSTNEDSLVLLIRLGDDLQILYTGDAGETVDAFFDFEGVDESVPLILKAAHHGSMYATSEAFLTHFRADLAVISCGQENSYGHPHRQMLERLKAHHIPWQTTAQNGAVWIEACAHHLVYYHIFEDHP